MPREGVLIAYGENYVLTLAQVDSQGKLVALAEPLRMNANCWRRPRLSPDGTLLAYFGLPPDFDEQLALYDLQTGQERVIRLRDGPMSAPVFDEAGRHLAYTVLVDDFERWATYVRDLSTGSEAAYLGPFVGQGGEWHEPLPGEPIAWVGNELFVDQYIPWQETMNWGITVLDLEGAVPGQTHVVDSYDRRVLDPAAVRYTNPTLSPRGDLLAFVVSGHDYAPTCYDASTADGVLSGVGIVPAAGGAPRILVDTSKEDGAVSYLPLTWSPDGKQILFAQGNCQRDSAELADTLRAVDLKGVITHEWPQARIGDQVCQEALWCTPGQIFYKRSFWGDEQLWRLNVETGESERVLSSGQIQLVGCFP